MIVYKKKKANGYQLYYDPIAGCVEDVKSNVAFVDLQYLSLQVVHNQRAPKSDAVTENNYKEDSDDQFTLGGVFLQIQ